MEKEKVFGATAKIKKDRILKRSADEKRRLVISVLRGFAFFVFSALLGTREMLFESYPLGFALLSASGGDAPFVLLGLLLSAIEGGNINAPIIVGACMLLLVRTLASIFLEGKHRVSKPEKDGFFSALAYIYSENVHLRVMSGAIGVFLVGVWRIIAGGFRFYDLFAAMLYLILTPIATLLFSPYFVTRAKKESEGKAFAITPSEERFYSLSCLILLCALVFALEGYNLLGVSVPLFVGAIITLYACRRGVLYGTVAGLILGASVAPIYAPMLAFSAVAYCSIYKLSIFGGAMAACIAGLVWGIYLDGASALASVLPSLLCSTMTFCAAQKLSLFDDINDFLKRAEKKDADEPFEALLTEQKINLRDERLRSISDSFSSLSEIFYNLSSKLKRPSMLDLRSICEGSFERKCEGCERHAECFGAEYAQALDAMKKITLQLHTHGLADVKKLPENFKKKCPFHAELVGEINRACSIATKKAFQNEKTEIFALDYDAISVILNDAIAENEEEFKIDTKMSKKIAAAISEAGYGEHSVMVFGKRKLKILARGLDLSEQSADVQTLVDKLEDVCGVTLAEPTFELNFGSVNMQIEAKRAYSADCAFANAACESERVCGDTVSIFENKNDYLYALLSDGMGTGKEAALASEICNVFLRNMLDAGNRMDSSLRMLNSVLRTKSTRSEDECSATVDLLQLDLYSGALTLVKSGAAPTFVLRRENVFKLASPSFPIGILRSPDIGRLNIGCEDGDLIVMVSDGALVGGDNSDYISELLREKNIADDPPQKIADKILRRAKAECNSPTSSDDISIVVLKIKKDICNW